MSDNTLMQTHKERSCGTPDGWPRCMAGKRMTAATGGMPSPSKAVTRGMVSTRDCMRRPARRRCSPARAACRCCACCACCVCCTCCCCWGCSAGCQKLLSSALNTCRGQTHAVLWWSEQTGSLGWPERYQAAAGTATGTGVRECTAATGMPPWHNKAATLLPSSCHLHASRLACASGSL